MSEIPEDVMKRARVFFMNTYTGSESMVDIIARAIMVERERCAAVCTRMADDFSHPTKGDFVRADALLDAANAILAPTPPKGASHDQA